MERSMISSIDLGNGLAMCESNNKSKKRSMAWDHFEKIPTPNKEEGKARCKHCDSLFASTPKSGTSHLKRHVERCPKRPAVFVQPIAVEPASVEPVAVDYGITEFEGSGNCGKIGKRVSKVWEEYDLYPAPNMNDAKAKCKHCNLVLSGASKNGTSHLKRHLEKCPRRVIMNSNIEKYFITSDRQMEENNLDKSPKCETPSSNMKFLSAINDHVAEENKSPDDCPVDQDELQRCISVFITKGGHPFSLVEESGFRSMMSTACPQFKPFSRAIVRKELFSMYVKERDHIKELLYKAPGRVCLTVSKRKSRDTKDEYICVTGNFIDDCWKLCRRILCFKALAPPYDGSYIADELACVSSQYSIDHKTFSITVDAISYDEPAVSSIKRGLLTEKALASGNSIFQVNCYTHVLNLLAKSTLKLVDDILDRIRELIKYVNKSPLQRKKFFDLAERTFGIQARKRLSLDELLKWSSTYKLIDHSLYYRVVFNHIVESKQELSSLALTLDEWLRLSVVNKFLKILYGVTRLFSGSNSPTANVFLKGMLMVHCRMMEIAKGPNLYLANAFKAMQAKFDDLWCDNNLILSCAAVLDPRFKVKFVEYCYTKLHGPGNVQNYISKVVSTLYTLFTEYNHRSLLGSSRNGGSSCVNMGFVGGSDEGDLFGDYDQFLSSTSSSQRNQSELDLYLEELSFDLNSDIDVLEFWSRSSMKYPELSVMARDVLSIPVSTVNLKEAFSIGGKNVPSIQSSITPETLQALLCLQDWLSADDVSVEDMSGTSEDGEYDDEDDDSVLTDSF